MQNKINRFFRNSLIVAALAGSTLATTQPVAAQGDLLVAPTRVILDGRRGTEVILSNIGTEEATYRISLELRRMTEEGGLIDVELENANSAEQAALDMIRYAPRRITLPPGQPQAVRIAARAGADLPDGEYRVHMQFRAIPKPVAVTEQPEEVEGMRFQLIPVYGVTIPVIVRRGRLEAQVAIAQPRIEADAEKANIVLTLNRSGQASTYGDLLIKRQGSDEVIYSARGLAVYPEVNSREFKLPVPMAHAGQLAGPVRVEYRESAAAGGNLIAALDTVLK